VKDHEDAYGRLVLDHLEHQTGSEVVERDDGYIVGVIERA
jgi:hypothetical protein